MAPDSDRISRRAVLRTAGSAAALGALSGVAGARGDEQVEVNVGYDGASGRRAARDAADSVVREFSFDALTVVVNRNAVDGLEKRRDVRYVEENGAMHALAQDLPWGVDRVDAEVAHANGETGDGAHVAIIDTGIDDDHPDLEANVGAGKAFVSCKGSNCNDAWSDDNDHGTHCAGIADAVDNSRGVVGVSTQVTLHAVKVLDSRGSGTFSDVAAGIEYTADQGWDVGSMSLGASSGSSVVRDACQYAYGEGVLLVAAAGNDGPCTDCVGYPAAYSEVVAVGATASDDSLASFSSTGPEVELAAPGASIYSTVVGGYDTFSGTSMACPHVSGAGAQLMANGSSNAQARDTLRSSAEDVGLASDESGAGLLDVAASLGLDSSDDLGGGGGGGGGDTAPTVDSLSLAEDNGGGSPHADFDASWSVGDADGDLDTVDLTLTDADAGTTEDAATVDVGGESASGTASLTAKFDENNGHTYRVELVVTDAGGNTASDTASEVEDGS